MQNCTFIGRAEVSPTQVNSIEIFLFIEGLRVTSSPIETNLKFHVKFTSAWQARLAYKCVPYSSHSYSSSGISVQMNASSLGLNHRYASSWKTEGNATKWATEFEFAMQKWRFNDVIAVALLYQTAIVTNFRVDIKWNYAVTLTNVKDMDFIGPSTAITESGIPDECWSRLDGASRNSKSTYHC